MRIASAVALLSLLLPAIGAFAAAPPEPRREVLTFLHTNDLHGRVLSGLDFEDGSRGGLARAATLARETLRGNPRAILVDSGDLIHGAPVEFLTRGRSMIEAMNAAGVSISCPGNHEFDWGQDAALAAMKRARFAWVSANVLDARTGRPLGPLKPYVIRRMGEVRVAFLGLTTQETAELEWPPFLSRVRFADPTETARRWVPELRRRADLVVVLSHLGFYEDIHLAQDVPGIDVILGGHSHTAIQERGEIGGTQIAQAGYYGQFLGRLDLLAERGQDGAWKVVDVNGREGRWWGAAGPVPGVFPERTLLPLGPEIAPDPAVRAAYLRYWNRWKALSAERAATLRAPIDSSGAPGETNLARFHADLLRRATGADLALVDGNWEGSLPAGPVSVAQLWSSMSGYTGQNILRFEAEGARIAAFLERWAGAGSALAVGVSGLEAELDASREAGHRLLRAWIGGRPLDPAARYQVAAVMYVARRFPSLFEAAGAAARGGPVEWSRLLALQAARQAGELGPSTAPRLRWVREPGGPARILLVSSL